MHPSPRQCDRIGGRIGRAEKVPQLSATTHKFFAARCNYILDEHVIQRLLSTGNMANDASLVTTSASQFGLGNRIYHPRAPSRSPTRLSELQSRDSLLSDLTPATILQALSSTAVFQSNEHRPLNSLEASIVKASSTEKVFCIKAAVASNKLREWYEEVAGWEWPSGESPSDTSKGFEVPSLEERKAKRRKLHRHEHDAYGSANASDILGHPKARSASQIRDTEDDLEFWGCLPVKEAIRCEERVRQIEAELEGLELDDLKEHVLGSGHYSNEACDFD